MDVKDSYIFIIDGMDVSGFMFLRFEEHLDDNPVKPANFRHFSFFSAKVNNKNQTCKSF